MKVDSVEFRGDQPAEEMRNYMSVEYISGWVIWRWNNEEVAIPSDLIKEIYTTQE